TVNCERISGFEVREIQIVTKGKRDGKEGENVCLRSLTRIGRNVVVYPGLGVVGSGPMKVVVKNESRWPVYLKRHGPICAVIRAMQSEGNVREEGVDEKNEIVEVLEGAMVDKVPDKIIAPEDKRPEDRVFGDLGLKFGDDVKAKEETDRYVRWI